MRILRALRSGFSLPLLALLIGLQGLLALIPAASSSRLLSAHPPFNGAAYGAADFRWSFEERGEAWGDVSRAATLFSRTGLANILGAAVSGGVLLSLSASALLYVLILQFLWPGALKLLAREKGFGAAVRSLGWPFFLVGVAQLLLYWGVYALLLVFWGNRMGNLIKSSPTEFLSILLGAVQVMVFLCVFFLVRLFFSFLKIGMLQANARLPFKQAWPALLQSLKHYPMAAAFFAGLFTVWFACVWFTGLNVFTLLLRDYFHLVGWAFLLQIFSPSTPAINKAEA
jgi:hypothetical protein